jgi:hypothetical protein
MVIWPNMFKMLCLFVEFEARLSEGNKAAAEHEKFKVLGFEISTKLQCLSNGEGRNEDIIRKSLCPRGETGIEELGV